MARPSPAVFRAEAVELVRTSGQSIRSLAADLGIAEQTLRNWVRQAAIDAGEREGLTTRLGVVGYPRSEARLTRRG